MNILDDPYGTLTGGTAPPPGTPLPPWQKLMPTTTTGILDRTQPTTTVTQPDWQKLLDQYLAPYKSIYDAQMKAYQDRVAAQTQLANQRFSGSDTSTMARLADEHNDLARRITNTLAGQGLFNSGATPFQQNRENLRYKRAETDASNALLDYLTGLQSGLADAQFQGRLGLENTRLGLGTTLGSLYQPTVTTSNPLAWPDGTGTSSGAAPSSGLPKIPGWPS